MKKVLFFFVVIFGLILVGCEEPETIDYDDFEHLKQSSYTSAENKTPNRYMLYYYSESCSHCNDVKADLLNFVETFELLDLYLIDVGSETIKDVSQFSEFIGTPSLFIIADGKVVETYIGSKDILEFIEKYEDITLDYTYFNNQYVNTFDAITSVEKEDYIVYYYNDDCASCEAVKDIFLQFAVKRPPEEIIFLDKSRMAHLDNMPDALHNIEDGPAIIEMSLGYVINVYEGETAVRSYISSHQDEALDIDEPSLDYDDFSELHLSNYNETLVVDNTVHFEYFYSPYCTYCNNIKPDVLSFFDTLEDVPFYLININTVEGDNTIDNLSGVPALLIVANNEVVEMYTGNTDIPTFIEAYQTGDIDLTTYE
ncbi:MAG: thioredoxin family protein [Candidatus Izimaplasma sp.]|nr:thioredoxin family protein [Candidatus Izimaplasma bacterium]